MKPWVERIYNGIVKENPSFVLMLGMCPTLAVTTSASNGIGMGLSTMAVLIVSNLIISLVRKIVPDDVRLPAYIVIVASLVTVVELLMEAYASKNPPFLSVMDGVGMGLGFTIALLLIGMVRELVGAGTLFGMKVTPEAYNPVGIFVKAPGAFLVLAFLVAIMNAVGMKTRANKVVEGCDGCCAACSQSCTDKKEEKA